MYKHVLRKVEIPIICLQAATQDDNDDPDNMTYEQRQALVESVGNENRGLSDLLISYLETWKYKSGFFPRKANHDKYVYHFSFQSITY
jgi:hypothetical protein